MSAFHRDPMEGNHYPDRGDGRSVPPRPTCDEQLPGCTEFAEVFSVEADGAKHHRCFSCQQAAARLRQPVMRPPRGPCDPG